MAPTLLPSLTALVSALLFLAELSLLPEEGTSQSHVGWGGAWDSDNAVLLLVLASHPSIPPFRFSVLEHTLSSKAEKRPMPWPWGCQQQQEFLHFLQP